MQNLFDIPEAQWKFERKVRKLRERIRARTKELNILPDHDENSHYYISDGMRYPSVSKRLELLKDASLANWKVNRVVDQILREYGTLRAICADGDAIVLQEFLERCKLAPQIEFKNAGSIGTQIHNWREQRFTAIINNHTETQLPTNTLPEIVSGCRAVNKFLQETHYIPLATEIPLIDHEIETGGSGDDIGILNGEVTFLDLKSSNIGNKNSYFYQVALYVYMFEKLYKIKTTSHKILHVSKTDGTYNIINIPDIRKRIKEAKQIVKVDQFLDKLKEEKKPKLITI